MELTEIPNESQMGFMQLEIQVPLRITKAFNKSLKKAARDAGVKRADVLRESAKIGLPTYLQRIEEGSRNQVTATSK